MQMLLLENIALTFAEDAYALVIGAGKIAAKFLTNSPWRQSNG